MENNLNSEIEAQINILDQCLERVSSMLVLGKQGEPFLIGMEFHESELKALDNNLRVLVARILKRPDVEESVWLPPVAFAYRYGQPSRSQWSWLESFYRGLSNSKSFLLSHLKSNDSPNTYNINVKGDNAIIGINSRISANNNSTSSETALHLMAQIELLRVEMRKATGTSPEEDIAIATVAAAEVAARNGDNAGAMLHLKKAGQWAFDVATKIGVSVVAKMIEGQLPK